MLSIRNKYTAKHVRSIKETMNLTNERTNEANRKRNIVIKILKVGHMISKRDDGKIVWEFVRSTNANVVVCSRQGRQWNKTRNTMHDNDEPMNDVSSNNRRWWRRRRCRDGLSANCVWRFTLCLFLAYFLFLFFFFRCIVTEEKQHARLLIVWTETLHISFFFCSFRWLKLVRIFRIHQKKSRNDFG